MSAHVLLNLLNELGKRDKMRGLPSILSLFRNKFNKFNNTRARMLDSIYHMTNTLKSHFWRKKLFHSQTRRYMINVINTLLWTVLKFVWLQKQININVLDLASMI